MEGTAEVSGVAGVGGLLWFCMAGLLFSTGPGRVLLSPLT